MAHNPINLNYTGQLKRNYDGSFNPLYPEGDKPIAYYFDIHYPEIPKTEPTIDNQRFVDAVNGSDANDGTQGNPWQTLAKAFQELAQSTTWYCLNISSNITVTTRIWTKGWGDGPGKLGSPFIVRSDPNVPRVTITLNDEVEWDGQCHGLWYGFDMAGTRGFNFGYDTESHHQTVRLVNGVMTGTGGDNMGFFQSRSVRGDYLGIFGCDFTGPGQGSGIHGNTACVILFVTPHFKIENNIMRNAPRPIYFKHSNIPLYGAADISVKGNFIPTGNCAFAGRAEGGLIIIKHNFFGERMEISNQGGGMQPEGHVIEHNTFMIDLILSVSDDPVLNAIVRNNVFVQDYENLRYQDHPNTNTSNFNLFGRSIYHKGGIHDLAEWKSISGQDANSIAGTPVFVGGATPNTPAGVALDPSSPGYQAASTGLNMGADASQLGVL